MGACAREIMERVNRVKEGSVLWIVFMPSCTFVPSGSCNYRRRGFGEEVVVRGGCRASGDVVEGVEDQVGLAWADLVGGETVNHFVDGALEVRLSGGEREVEGLAATAAAGILDRLAGGVVVVAEGFALEGGRSTAVASVEDVGAEGADVLDDFDGLVHGYPPWVLFAQSLMRKRLRFGLGML
jgi:hypothetical protein